MIKLSPSILAADFTALGAECARVTAAGAEMLHIDVMDGLFVPNITIGVPVLAALAHKVPAIYDVHLMIQNPLRYVEAFAKAGANWMTFHLEAESPVAETLSAIRACGCRAGLSVRPGTPIEAVFPYLDTLDMVLVMSVEPGFGGQAFQPAAADRLSALRDELMRRGIPLGNCGVELEVDGGINSKTAAVCACAGATILVAGSAVFCAPDAAAAMRDMRTACAASSCF